MLLVPLALVAVAVVALQQVVHRRRASVTGAPARGGAVRPFWPTTTAGRVGVGAFVVALVPVVLVNVVQVAFLGGALQVVAAGCTAFARFARQDRSSAVLAALVVASAAVVAALLFLAGEVLVGHA